MKHVNILALSIILFIQIGCKTVRLAEINCEPDVHGIETNASIEDYETWEECLIKKNINTKTKKELYNDIKGNLIHKSLLVGYSGEISQPYLSSKALTEILTDKEIDANLYSEDKGIKYNSFYTIAKREKEKVIESLKIVIQDTTKVYEQYGCIVDELSFADLCINLVMGIEHDGETYLLNDHEVNLLDSLVNANNLRIRYRDWMNEK